MANAILAFDDQSSALLRESLRTVLLGGSWPPGGRRAVWRLVDALRPDDTDEFVLVGEEDA